MIHFTHVTKSYEDNWKALSNVTLRIHKGEFVFLTGHSGAGKSTMLKLIYMDERPDAERGGQVMVKFTGDCVYDSKNTPDSKIQGFRRKMGIIFQDFKLLPDRNVFENVALALRIVGTPSNKINAAVFDALNEFVCFFNYCKVSCNIHVEHMVRTESSDSRNHFAFDICADRFAEFFTESSSYGRSCKEDYLL